MNGVQDIWAYLATNPLLHLTCTLAAYQVGTWIYKKFNLNPLLNPVLIAIVIIVALLLSTKTDYQTYFQGAQFVHFLLGPATVALAIPLYRQFEKVKQSAFALIISLTCGSITAAMSAVGLVILLGGTEQTYISIAPKSVTAPIAMGISEQLGGLPSLTAVLVILTGILGGVIGPYVLNIFRIKNWAARGLAIGTAAHGIGTARALQINETAGAFSGLAMGLNALATALLLPIIWKILF